MSRLPRPFHGSASRDGASQSRRHPLLIAALVAGVLASCASDEDASSSAPLEAPASIEAETPAEGSVGDVGGLTASAARSEAIEVDIVLATPDVARTSDAVVDLARSSDGEVRRAEVRLDPNGSGSSGAYVILGVPPAALDTTLERLTQFGTLLGRTQQTEDVTDQVVDLETRITSAQRSIARVQDLLDDAEDLDDVVLLERELTSRQTELETMLASQAVLADRVELATVRVEIRPVAEPDDGIGDALGTGLRAFVSALETLVIIVAYLAPFLALAALAAWAAWFIRRKAQRNRSAVPPNPPTPTPGP